MEPRSAEILTEQVTGDERAAVRRSLKLGVSAYSSGDVVVALILNMSETGLLIETGLKLAVGETLHVQIPEASASTARVIWTEGLLAGCEFVNPVSTGAVSAARLRSPVESADSTSKPSAADAGFQAEDDPADPDDAIFQTIIVVIIALIAVLALLIFLAAILPL